MKAAIVTIGDEILIGQIVDTNSSYIAKALDKIGIETHETPSMPPQRSAGVLRSPSTPPPRFFAAPHLEPEP